MLLPVDVQVNPDHLDLDSPSCILAGTSRRYYVPDFPGTLSVKWVVRGRAEYVTSEGRHLLDPSGWLLLAHGQHYRMTIESAEATETLVPFLRRGLVGEAAKALGEPEGALDDPGRPLPVLVTERVRRHHPTISPILRRLHAGVREGVPYDGYLEEQIHDLAGGLASLGRDVRAKVSRLGGVRASTRVEIFRRLDRALELIEGNLARPLGLDEMARIACLSPYHFHRQFTLAFGAPPHRFIALRRLEEARRLLEGTGRSVSDVCLDVGFHSLGSFSALFRRRFGVPPSAVRKKQA